MHFCALPCRSAWIRWSHVAQVPLGEEFCTSTPKRCTVYTYQRCCHCNLHTALSHDYTWPVLSVPALGWICLNNWGRPRRIKYRKLTVVLKCDSVTNEKKLLLLVKRWGTTLTYSILLVKHPFVWKKHVASILVMLANFRFHCENSCLSLLSFLYGCTLNPSLCTGTRPKCILWKHLLQPKREGVLLSPHTLKWVWESFLMAVHCITVLLIQLPILFTL